MNVTLHVINAFMIKPCAELVDLSACRAATFGAHFEAPKLANLGRERSLPHPKLGTNLAGAIIHHVDLPHVLGIRPATNLQVVHENSDNRLFRRSTLTILDRCECGAHLCLEN